MTGLLTAPETVGVVASKGAPAVTMEKDAGQYVSNKAKLARLLGKPPG